MKYTVYKILAVAVSGFLLFTSTGKGMAGKQWRLNKTLTEEPLLLQRARISGLRPTKWYTFTGPDGDFTLQFPFKPQHEEDIQGPFAMIRRYSSTANTYYFGIVYQDVGPEASTLRQTHEEDTSALLQDQGYIIVSIRRLSKNITQMELWSPSQTPKKFLHRIDRTIVSNGRMYTLGCSSRIAGREVDKSVCRRFFNSFRIIGVPN